MVKVETSWNEIGKLGLMAGIEIFLMFMFNGMVFEAFMLAPLIQFLFILKKSKK